jgi:hypothetical protein
VLYATLKAETPLSLTKNWNDKNKLQLDSKNLVHLKNLINHTKTVGHKTGLKLTTETNKEILLMWL